MKKLFFIILLLLVCFCSCTSTYMGRYLRWNFSSVEDYRKFPFRSISSGGRPLLFRTENSRPPFAKKVEYSYKGEQRSCDLDRLLETTGTTAFIVMQDDRILYERYLNGHRRDSICRSFSVSKSVISALVGIALDEGDLRSVDEPFVNYLPELRGRGLDRVTIRQLLMMCSGIKFSQGILPWNDLALLYYVPDLRSYVLTHVRKDREPGTRFLYSSYNTLLLGIILERATGKTVSKYLQEKIWQPLGMEYPALWSLNSEEDGFESCPSGLNARAIDFARFGRLFLNKGRWGERRILSEKWVDDSTTPPPEAAPGYYPRSVLADRLYYKYQWWGHRLAPDDYSFFATGQYGQIIYVNPKRKLVIVRFGERTGKIDHGWQEVARNIAESIQPERHDRHEKAQRAPKKPEISCSRFLREGAASVDKDFFVFFAPFCGKTALTEFHERRFQWLTSLSSPGHHRGSARPVRAPSPKTAGSLCSPPDAVRGWSS